MQAEDERLAASRALVGEFAAELSAALGGAIEAEGPAAAVAVCRDLAPEIASRLSRQSGTRISRISSRFRNPQNLPEPWQRQALDQLQNEMPDPATRAFSDPAALPEQFAVDARGEARYLKAIAIAPLCLTCHGEQLSETVRGQLAEHYPHDRATGYQLGELRGAFSVVWPVP